MGGFYQDFVGQQYDLVVFVVEVDVDGVVVVQVYMGGIWEGQFVLFVGSVVGVGQQVVDWDVVVGYVEFDVQCQYQFQGVVVELVQVVFEVCVVGQQGVVCWFVGGFCQVLVEVVELFLGVFVFGMCCVLVVEGVVIVGMGFVGVEQ